MPDTQSLALPREKFLLIAVNLLHRALLQPPRTEAKQVFRELAGGRTLALNPVEMEDRSTARFGLALDASEYRGRLNYGAFRAGLETLVGNLAAYLREDREVAVFDAREGGTGMVFGVSAVTVEEQQANVMVLGAESGAEHTLLRLMYLDPDQFDQQAS